MRITGVVSFRGNFNKLRCFSIKEKYKIHIHSFCLIILTIITMPLDQEGKAFGLLPIHWHRHMINTIQLVPFHRELEGMDKKLHPYSKLWGALTYPWASCQIRQIAGAHAPGMPGTFSPPPRVSNPDMHHGTCVTHVPWCMPGSLTRVFLWIRRRGETFPAFPAHAQP